MKEREKMVSVKNGITEREIWGTFACPISFSHFTHHVKVVHGSTKGNILIHS